LKQKKSKIENYINFELVKKKIWDNLQRIVKLSSQKIVIKLSKIWDWNPGSGIRDPGSGIRKKSISDPGSRGQKGTGSRIRIRNTELFSAYLMASTWLSTSSSSPSASLLSLHSLDTCPKQF
jgi:hypothetical protein